MLWSFTKKILFGREEVVDIHIHPNLWAKEELPSSRDNEGLVKPFTFEEVECVIREMKN